MKCPVCTNHLKAQTVEQVTVDVCDGGCGGIWFDNYELQKMDENHEIVGVQLLDISRDPNIKVDHTQQRNCPKCSDVIMMRHFFSPKQQVEIDECAGCGGVWLDSGELAQIRNLFDSPEAQEQAVKEFMEKTIHPQLSDMKAKSRQDLQRAKKFSTIFKFICPTYWIPGKQEWGAF